MGKRKINNRGKEGDDWETYTYIWNTHVFQKFLAFFVVLRSDFHQPPLKLFNVVRVPFQSGVARV